MLCCFWLAVLLPVSHSLSIQTTPLRIIFMSRHLNLRGIDREMGLIRNEAFLGNSRQWVRLRLARAHTNVPITGHFIRYNFTSHIRPESHLPRGIVLRV